jgi:putative toxin-antitoxin system antitoxin component (TIGR02293 family)
MGKDIFPMQKTKDKIVKSSWIGRKAGSVKVAAASQLTKKTKQSNFLGYPHISPMEVVIELTGSYGISTRDLANVLDITPKTFSRWNGRDDAMSEQQADRLMIVKSILDLGKKVLGSEENVKKWLHEPIFLLDGNAPLELIKTESGRRKVEAALQQIHHGYF